MEKNMKKNVYVHYIYSVYIYIYIYIYIYTHTHTHTHTCMLEKEVATHFSILGLKNPWTEEPVRLHSMGSQELDTT